MTFDRAGRWVTLCEEHYGVRAGTGLASRTAGDIEHALLTGEVRAAATGLGIPADRLAELARRNNLDQHQILMILAMTATLVKEGKTVLPSQRATAPPRRAAAGGPGAGHPGAGLWAADQLAATEARDLRIAGGGS
jgi:hypothetical protein